MTDDFSPVATSRLLGQSAGASLVALCMLRFGNAGLHAAIWLAAGLAVAACMTSALRVLPSLRATEEGR